MLMKLKVNYSPIRKHLKQLGLLTIGLLIALSFLYHNDYCYKLFKNQINVRLQNYFQIDALNFTNNIAHSLDIKGKLWGVFHPVNKSEIIELVISEKNQKKLHELAKLGTKGKDTWLKIKVKINGSLHRAKMKLRGTSSVHFTGGKYSYKIKLSKKSDYFNNIRVFNVTKGIDADPTGIAANRIASKLGLIAPFGKMVVLKINDEEQGHYYFVEHLSKQYLERQHGITNYSILSNVTDWSRKENDFYGSAHISDHDLYFGHIESDDKPLHHIAIGMYKNLCEEIEHNNIEGVKELIDIDYMGRYLALMSLFNDVHQITGDNFKLIYDFSKRKFYPLYRQEQGAIPLFSQVFSQEDIFFNSYANYNKLIFYKSLPNYIKSTNTKLLKLLLSDNAIRNSRDHNLMKLVANGDKVVQLLTETYEQNERVMYPNTSRRVYHFQKMKQLDVFNDFSVLANKYLHYGHIYGSYNLAKSELYFIADAFSQIEIHHKSDSIEPYQVNGIGFDYKLDFKYKYDTIRLNGIKNIGDLSFINLVTKDTISSEHIHINIINDEDSKFNSRTEKMLKANNINFKIDGKNVLIKKGVFKIKSDVIIGPNMLCTISKGTTLLIGNNVNFIIGGSLFAEGNVNEKIKIQNLDSDSCFGVFAVLGKDSLSQVRMNFVDISGGSEITKYGLIFTGQCAIYDSKVSIKNSNFLYSKGDDGLNVKHSSVDISDSFFGYNRADQVDLDFCTGLISNCIYKPSLSDPNGDGLDISGSEILVKKSKFSGFLDKGFSIGENSKALISDSYFESNNISIALKDSSVVYSLKNNFNDNTLNYSLFVKKKIFGIPTLYIPNKVDTALIKNLQGNVFLSNMTDIENKKQNFITNFKDQEKHQDLESVIF